MFLPILFSKNYQMKEVYSNQLLELNEKMKEYGLQLTEKDAKQLIKARNHTLQKFERVELGINVTESIIDLFSASPFINPENYFRIFMEVQEIFYYFKNETEDRISDEDLLKIIYIFFDRECEGSIQLLKGKMEEYARNFRLEQIKQDLTNEGKDIYEKR